MRHHGKTTIGVLSMMRSARGKEGVLLRQINGLDKKSYLYRYTNWKNVGSDQVSMFLFQYLQRRRLPSRFNAYCSLELSVNATDSGHNATRAHELLKTCRRYCCGGRNLTRNAKHICLRSRYRPPCGKKKKGPFLSFSGCEYSRAGSVHLIHLYHNFP